ncbi:MAG: PIN domain-containing protein [Anaerolineae bacterium]
MPKIQQRLYLDTNVYNRPFDEQEQPRIWLETLAFAVILQMVEVESVILVRSSVLDYENSRNPSRARRRWVARCLDSAGFYQPVNQDIRRRAEALEKAGVRALDALHVTCAEAAESDFFLTCDDRLINRYEGELTVVNPVDFVLSEGG